MLRIGIMAYHQCMNEGSNHGESVAYEDLFRRGDSRSAGNSRPSAFFLGHGLWRRMQDN